MIKKPSTLISGLLAVGIYIGVISLLLFYFNTRDEKKPVHFVKKNEERIRVSMSTPKPQVKKEITTAPKKVVKPKPKPKPKPKKEVKKKVVEKKIIKEKVVKKAKVVKKKKDVNTTKPKKVNKPKDLFANITSKKKIEKPKPVKTIPVKPKKVEIKKVANKTSASDLVSDSLKREKQSDTGIENAYLAKIEEKLKGWPAQSEYAGEKAKVWLRVEPNGRFQYEVITASGNEAFNTGLMAYLEQLQKIGFGPHKGNRAYELDVEFVATE
ncbi:TonB C-terminal domain-containing protein [Sulfurovum sp. XGS-02]|uniref:TonB C-terminal domain-containing protein n=1 Tax=Sulfurovum sp. XGS-02 TaxID=2925411 RepID=UPI00206246CE|nr:TonB C-terminal domain-containing protein [Sulfurovum sp. XGS-02]UPT77003.1 TonB C-terminal domain-containing protein [Sulfurovum sp. XGS-02]